MKSLCVNYLNITQLLIIFPLFKAWVEVIVFFCVTVQISYNDCISYNGCISLNGCNQFNWFYWLHVIFLLPVYTFTRGLTKCGAYEETRIAQVANQLPRTNGFTSPLKDAGMNTSFLRVELSLLIGDKSLYLVGLEPATFRLQASTLTSRPLVLIILIVTVAVVLHFNQVLVVEPQIYF